jgi:hypothetical protein
VDFGTNKRPAIQEKIAEKLLHDFSRELGIPCDDGFGFAFA